MGYDAFLSYKHGVDDELVPAVERALRRFAKPWRKREAMRVFRDNLVLETGALWPAIQDALDQTDHLVLFMSPEAAASDGVNQEIAYWKRLHGDRAGERILPVLSGGVLKWDGGAGDWDYAASTAASPLLAGVFEHEPRFLDLSWAHGEADLTLDNPQFLLAIADLAAPIRGIPKEDLISEDVAIHKRATLIRRAVGVALVVLTLLAFVGGCEAVRNAQEAADERDRAEGALADLEAANGTIDEATARIDGLEAQEAALAEANAQAQADIEAAEADLQAKQDELDDKQAELDGKQDELDDAEATIDGLEDEQGRLTAANERAAIDLQTSRSQTAAQEALADAFRIANAASAAFAFDAELGTLLAVESARRAAEADGTGATFSLSSVPSDVPPAVHAALFAANSSAYRGRLGSTWALPAFSPDGEYVVLDDGESAVVYTAEGVRHGSWDLGPDRFGNARVEWVPGSTDLVSRSADGSVTSWAADGRKLVDFGTVTTSGAGFWLTPAGDAVLLDLGGGRIEVRWLDGSVRSTLRHPGADEVVMSPTDGVVLSDGDVVTLWNLDGNLRATLEGEARGLFLSGQIHWASDGSRFSVVYLDRVEVYDSTGALADSIAHPPALAPREAFFLADGTIVSPGRNSFFDMAPDHSVFLRSVRGVVPAIEVVLPTDSYSIPQIGPPIRLALSDVEINPSDPTVVAIVEDETVRIYEIAHCDACEEVLEPYRVAAAATPPDGILDVWWSDDGSWLFVQDGGGVRVHEFRTTGFFTAELAEVAYLTVPAPRPGFESPLGVEDAGDVVVITDRRGGAPVLWELDAGLRHEVDESGDVSSLSIEDSGLIAYRGADATGGSELVVIHPDGTDRRHSHPGLESWLFGRDRLVTLSDGTIRRWSADGTFSEGGVTEGMIVGLVDVGDDDVNVVSHAPEFGVGLTWDVDTRYLPVDGEIRAVTVAANRVVVMTDTGVQFWTPAGRLESVIGASSEIGLTSVHVSDDGSTVALADASTVRIWDRAGRFLATIGDGSLLSQVAVAPDGARVLVKPLGGAAEVWTTTGDLVGQLAETHSSTVVGFLADGGLLVRDEVAGVSIFDEVGGEIARLHLGAHEAVAVSEDGRWVVVGLRSHLTAHRILDVPSLIDAAQVRLGRRTFSAEECDTYAISCD